MSKDKALVTKNEAGGTALAVLTPEEYPILVGGRSIAETIRQNMAGEPVTAGDLNRIKVPAGGATTWCVTNAAGEEESLKAVEGIIVHIARRRAYWESANPSGDPPTCASVDCVTGLGNPGGACEKCQMNVFGSSHKADGTVGRGKACKESKLLFMLRPGMMLPDVVIVPPGSLKALRQWQLKLGVPYWAILTRLGLMRTQNKDGIAFAQIVPVKADTLAAETAQQIMAYAQSLQSVFSAVELDRDDLEGDPATDAV